MEELVPRDTSITGESVHHTGVGCDRKNTSTRSIVSYRVVWGRRGDDLPTEIHTPDDDHHQNDGTLGAYRIEEDLGYWLTSWGVNCSVQILD